MGGCAVTEMTPQEIRAELRKIEKEVEGKSPHVWVNFNSGTGGMALHGKIRFDWLMGDDGAPPVEADTWPELLSGLRSGYAAYTKKYRADTVRKLALEIIRITAERGTCTEADLRMGPFSAEQVKTLVEEACQDADKIAANGPFNVLRDAAKANAA